MCDRVEVPEAAQRSGFLANESALAIALVVPLLWVLRQRGAASLF